MANMNVFMEATRKKMRFPSTKGMLTVEDLWDLNNNALNEVYMQLKSEKKEDDGLLPSSNSAYNQEIDVKLEIIRCIYDSKVYAQKVQESNEIRRQQKEKIKEILKDREDGALRNKSTEELEEMLKNLC